jgi:AbrB family looped-hinge helix DNA binding protein
MMASEAALQLGLEQTGRAVEGAVKHRLERHDLAIGVTQVHGPLEIAGAFQVARLVGGYVVSFEQGGKHGVVAVLAEGSRASIQRCLDRIGPACGPTASSRARKCSPCAVEKQAFPISQIAAYNDITASKCQKSEDMPTTSIHVSAGGRIVIPSQFRRSLGLKDGDEVLISLDDGVIRVFTRKQQLRRAQDLVRSHVPDSRSLAKELIVERREEAGRD